MDVKQHINILKDGLILDHLLILQSIYSGIKYEDNKRVEGFRNLLEKKEYVLNGIITEKGVSTLKKYGFITETPVQSNIYQACIDLLMELTGKKQISVDIRGTKYYFMCNERDLNKQIVKVMTTYKIKGEDLPKVEKTILNFIRRCHKTKSWTPLLQYYLFKDNKSAFITDFENGIEEEAPKKPEDKVKNKDLFG